MEPCSKATPYGGPFVSDNTKNRRISHVPVEANHVLAKGAFLNRAKLSDARGTLHVATVALQLHPLASEGFESVSEEEELGFWIHMGALMRLRDPGCTDLQAPMIGALIHESGRSDCSIGLLEDNRKAQDGTNSGDLFDHNPKVVRI